MSSSALFYLVVVVLSALSVCFKSFVKVISSQATSILLLIGLIMLTTNVFNTSANKTIVLYHRIISAFVVGRIAFVLFGAIRFFTNPTCPPTLGEHQSSMGLVVIMITIPLNSIELMMLLGAQASKNETSQTLREEERGPWERGCHPTLSPLIVMNYCDSNELSEILSGVLKSSNISKEVFLNMT